jgi:hypothetical protein
MTSLIMTNDEMMICTTTGETFTIGLQRMVRMLAEAEASCVT